MNHNKDKSNVILNATLPPSIIGIKGSNGIGKSTLASIISGALRQVKGEIIINGETDPKIRRQKVSFVSDVSVLRNDMSVARAIREYVYVMGGDFAKISSLEKEFEVGDSFSKRIIFLSTGLKKTAQIICTLSRETTVYIFDEPTNGLDEKRVTILENQILDLRRRDKVIILISHNPDFLKRLSDKIYALDDNGLRELDNVEESMEQGISRTKSRSGIEVELLGFSKDMSEQILGIGGVEDIEYNPSTNMNEDKIRQSLKDSGVDTAGLPIKVVSLPDDEAQALLEKLGGVKLDFPSSLREGKLLLYGDNLDMGVIFSKLEALGCKSKGFKPLQ